ncbi:MAG: hypothetical protein D6B25_18955 [Desulfobulbaceae bacterium]|nr:MAG: hypothetical protein D6B25_18955 [Desulfobulbaceae bacterium]
MTRLFRNLLIPFVAIFVLFVVPAGLIAETTAERKAEKARIEQGIKKYRINIRRLQQGIREQQEAIKENRKQERNLLAELEDIDTRLIEQQEKLRVLETRMNAQKELINVKQRELARAQDEKRAVQDHLQKRIQAYYKMGDIGFINVTFSTKTLPQLLKFHDSFRYLIEYDQNVIATYRHTIRELENSVETFEIEEALLEDFISQNNSEQDKIKTIKQEKQVLLSRIQTQKKLHAKAIEEMKKAAETLSSSLLVLQKKDELFDQSFLRNKGKIPPPVYGTVLNEFNQNVTNRLGISSVSSGISIDAPNGTMIRAVHEGTVKFSGYLRGYGNTVIVNHGYQYYSITSRIDRLLVKKGQRVSEKTDIGIMGDTATLMSQGVYFEIRHKSKPLDPLQWLDLQKIEQDT